MPYWIPQGVIICSATSGDWPASASVSQSAVASVVQELPSMTASYEFVLGLAGQNNVNLDCSTAVSPTGQLTQSPQWSTSVCGTLQMQVKSQ